MSVMEKPRKGAWYLWCTYIYFRVHRKFGKGVSNWGICNCRKIAGSSSWSDHAFCAAIDIHPRDRKTGDAVAKFLHKQRGDKSQYRWHIRYVLWWVDSHYDHLHLSVGPSNAGKTPDCAK